MQRLSDAKWAYVTRRVRDQVGALIGGVVRRPCLGDFVVAKVVELGELDHLENPYGRRMQLFDGDVVVGAYGNRYATDFYEGYLPGRDDPVQLLTTGGLIGTVASAHARRGSPTALDVLGPLTDPHGVALNTDDVALAPAVPRPAELGTVVVVGSAMNAGKTTTAAAITRGLARAGLRVGAGKVTGSGSGKDHWAYQDAGAAIVSDFVDFGMPSTFGYPMPRLITTMFGLRDQLVEQGADVVVLEVADGVLQPETRALAERLPGLADATVLAVADSLGAMAGIEVLARLGVTVDVVSGLVSASPLASQEVTAATGLAVLAPAEFVAGAAVDLLTGMTDRVGAVAGGAIGEVMEGASAGRPS
jgi:hypothetical protein